MNNEIVKQLWDLVSSAVLSILVWAYYRNRRHPASEKYSTFAPRFWAPTVDSCVLWPIEALCAVILSHDMPHVAAAVILFVQSAATFAYTAQMHASFGQTVGKRITKVRVVDVRTEGRITLRQAWLRESIPFVLCAGLLGYQIVRSMTSGQDPSEASRPETQTGMAFHAMITIPALWFLAEIVTMLSNDKRRALHDFIADTVVIRTDTLPHDDSPQEST